MTPQDRKREPWYENDNPARVVRGASWRGAIWITCAVVFVLALSAGIWALKVGTSDVKGQGDATSRKNSGTNRVAAQERFEELFANVKAADQRIDVMATAKQAAPDDVVAQANYTGAINFCIQTVADYNAEARKFSAQDWRAPDLPHQIDPLDKTTDCKGTSK
jgi:hypothetical protein